MAPRRCVVTGGSGFVGRRLVEMLIERGNYDIVVSFDVLPKPGNVDDKYDKNIEYVKV